MKTAFSKSQPKSSPPIAPPVSVPRLDSLLHRLTHAPGAKDHAYLDQLMIFLEDPPADTRDRWKEGAAMCTGWGIPCTGASVWRLYRSHALEWRLRVAEESGAFTGAQPKSLSKKIKLLVARRTYEILANPQSPAAAVLDIARIELRHQSLLLARAQYRDRREDHIALALKTLDQRTFFNDRACHALNIVKEALKEPPPEPSKFLTTLFEAGVLEHYPFPKSSA